jgi:pyrimidine operon attenuation protein / uracil phosphoribosyltransferase
MSDTRLALRRRLLDGKAIERRLDEMAEAIVSACPEPSALALVGVRTGGVPLAERLARRIEAATGVAPPLGRLDITLYRDDVFRGLEQPEVGPTEIDFRLGDRFVVLVDDVLYTGRTVRAAIDALMDFGRPRRILLAVLVDRGGRELPIAADVVGEGVEAGADETVEVRLGKSRDEDAVVVMGEAKPKVRR